MRPITIIKGNILVHKAGVILVIGTAAWFAVFAPWVYLWGILTAYVPTYIFLFKKAVDSKENETIITTKRLEGEPFSGYMLRKSIMCLSWLLACTFLWWMFLVISLSPKATDVFINGFRDGIK
jgi:hypothetical protein